MKALKKRILSFMLAFSMIFPTAGCGSKEKEETSESIIEETDSKVILDKIAESIDGITKNEKTTVKVGKLKDGSLYIK